MGGRNLLGCLVLGAAAVLVHADEAPSLSSAVASYHIGIDNLIDFLVWHNLDLSATGPVRLDGKISLPLFGDILAGACVPQDVAVDVKQKLETYVGDPQVAVIVTELRSYEYLPRVRVTGAVRQPVSVLLRQGMTVLDAVLATGGTTDFAVSDRAALSRKEGAGTHTYNVRLGRTMHKGDLDTNLVVEPGDIITVPERLF